MSEGTVHPLAQPVGRTHAAGAFDWRAVPSADPRASAFALDTAPALPAAAEEFSGEACREIVEDLLDRTRTGAAVAEVHAPFCESKCDGCGCWQHAYKELESRRWADALVREMAAWADTHAQAGAPIQALRFGGGTPSALEPVDILHVLAKARQYLPLSNDCSIELQARVHGFSEEKIEAALAGGVTRFVLPVRSFSTEVRQAAGRLDAGGAAEKLLKRLTEYNESAVAVELNFGLPGQSLEVWTADLERACQLPLDGLMIRAAGEPDMLGEAAKTFRAADPALMARMHERAFEVLADNGWERRTALTWSRSERDRTTFDVLAAGDADKFAFGCGAHGRLFGRELLIEPELGKWLSAVWMGRRPVSSVSEPKSGWRAAALLAQGGSSGGFLSNALNTRAVCASQNRSSRSLMTGLLPGSFAVQVLLVLGFVLPMQDFTGIRRLRLVWRSELMPQNCLSCRTDCWADAASKPQLKSFLPMCGRAQNGLRRSLDSLFLQSRTRIV
ncbi:radical SAM protein [Sutterella wadsworthensis]|uniref:radical SAM protein n=1 Tax=Sutterella wadsworthensis TaxID=40545 RepID=UPI002671E71A|nr:radical SAM protein [Sutterella wadsworthensis]